MEAMQWEEREVGSVESQIQFNINDSIVNLLRWTISAPISCFAREPHAVPAKIYARPLHTGEQLRDNITILTLEDIGLFPRR